MSCWHRQKSFIAGCICLSYLSDALSLLCSVHNDRGAALSDDIVPDLLPTRAAPSSWKLHLPGGVHTLRGNYGGPYVCVLFKGGGK